MGGGALWGDEKLPQAFHDKLKRMAASGRKQLAPAERRRVAKREQQKYEKMLNRRKR